MIVFVSVALGLTIVVIICRNQIAIPVDEEQLGGEFLQAVCESAKRVNAEKNYIELIEAHAECLTLLKYRTEVLLIAPHWH